MPTACDRRPSLGPGSVAVRLLPPKTNRLRTPRHAAAVPSRGHDPAAVVAYHLASCYLYREKKKIADTKKRKKKETRFLFFVLYNRRNNRNNSGPFTLCILGSRNCCEPSIQFRPGFGFTQRNRFKQTAGANNTKSYLFISRTSFYFFTGSRRNSDFHWVYCFLDAIRISMDFECV